MTLLFRTPTKFYTIAHGSEYAGGSDYSTGIHIYRGTTILLIFGIKILGFGIGLEFERKK